MKSTTGRIIATVLIAVLLGGCSGDRVEPPEPLRAVLGNMQTADARARGTAIIRVTPEQQVIEVHLQIFALGAITGASIHLGRVREVGPVLFTLGDPYGDTLSPFLVQRLTVDDCQARADLFPFLTSPDRHALFAAAMQALQEGRAYLVVRTRQFPEGELRGQIGVVPFQTTLSGAGAAPPVDNAAGGTVTAGLNRTQELIAVTVHAAGVADVIAVEIQVRNPADEGFPIFVLATPAGGVLPMPLTRALTDADLIEQPEQGIVNFEDAVRALVAGETWLVVRTASFPNGAIAGRIIPF